MSRIRFGSKVGGIATLDDPAAILNMIASDRGGTWSDASIQEGYAAIGFDPMTGAANTWAPGPAIILAKNVSTGVQTGYDVSYDSVENIYYRNSSPNNWAMGSGGMSDCGGCESCIIVFDSDLKTTGCDCIGNGGCGLTGGPIT